MTDIETRADCERLVREFYARAFADPIIGFLFTDIAKLDLEAHVPRITAFWETILLGARSYGGGAFRPRGRPHAPRRPGRVRGRAHDLALRSVASISRDRRAHAQRRVRRPIDVSDLRAALVRAPARTPRAHGGDGPSRTARARTARARPSRAGA